MHQKEKLYQENRKKAIMTDFEKISAQNQNKKL